MFFAKRDCTKFKDLGHNLEPAGPAGPLPALAEVSSQISIALAGNTCRAQQLCQSAGGSKAAIAAPCETAAGNLTCMKQTLVLRSGQHGKRADERSQQLGWQSKSYLQTEMLKIKW